VTADGGVTVERRPMPYRSSPAFFLTPQIGWATGEIRDEPGGCQFCTVVFRTADGAATWEEMWRSAAEFTDSVLFIDRLRGWAVQGRVRPDGSGTGIVSTADGGRTWAPELPNVPGKLIARGGRLWAVEGQLPAFGGGQLGSRTTIWRREYGGGAIALPDSGSGAGDGRDYPALAVMLGLAGALVWAAGRWLRDKRSR
jgi:hypothetical protein